MLNFKARRLYCISAFEGKVRNPWFRKAYYSLSVVFVTNLMIIIFASHSVTPYLWKYPREVVVRLGTKTPFMEKLPTRCTMGRVKGSDVFMLKTAAHWDKFMSNYLHFVAGVKFLPCWLHKSASCSGKLWLKQT